MLSCELNKLLHIVANYTSFKFAELECRIQTIEPLEKFIGKALKSFLASNHYGNLLSRERSVFN